jgi:hypothetical protein
VDEIADILEISNDSAYRRIRGEKHLSLHEVHKLSNHFNFSVDELTRSNISTVTFKTNFLVEKETSFRDWIKHLLSFSREVKKAEEAEMLFIWNEVNTFQIMQFPEVCAFKVFFWQKSHLDFSDYRDICFTFDELDDDVLQMIDELIDNYVKISTKEFTTRECLNGILKQVIYYSEAGFFSSRDDALTICGKLHQLIDHMQKQAELGFKFKSGKPPVGEEGNFLMYYNDIILADSTILLKAGDHRTAFMPCNALNVIYTHNREFFEYSYQVGKILLSKSIPISGTAEKERNSFFKLLRNEIDQVADRI